MTYIDHSATFRSFAPKTLRASLFTRLAVWRSRRQLAKLDAYALEDIGITAEEARREANLTVWDVPANWTQK